MRPKRRPYTGKIRILKNEMPRFVKLGSVALCKKMVESIEEIQRENSYTTRLLLKIPGPFFSYEEKRIRVSMAFDEVVSILNQY
jgi:hypothetical protein